MAKKKLGRGLEEISNIFLSKEGEEIAEGVSQGFSSLVLREESCVSCTNMITSPSAEAKCKIFSVDYEERGVTQMESVALACARHCIYFAPFSSDSLENDGNRETAESQLLQEGCEVQEAFRVERRIAFPGREDTQENMKMALLKYLEEGYAITSVKLRRVEEANGPRKSENKEEQVTLYVKGH